MPGDDDEEQEERISVRMFDSGSNDQLTKERGRCLEKDCNVRKVFLELRECDNRVMQKIEYTAETCHQELVDLMEALDHCVNGIAFHKIK